MNKLNYLIAFVLLSIFNLQAQDRIETLSNGKKIILHSDYTWEYQKAFEYNFDFSTIENNQIPNFLRQGISVNKKTLQKAIEIYLQGWKYTMPIPKSSKAYWGNNDGRTTWYKGYWHNREINILVLLQKNMLTGIIMETSKIPEGGEMEEVHYTHQ